MAAMPGCDPLECCASAQERGFVEIGGHKLERDRQSGRGKAAGQRDGRMTGRVEWAGVFLQSGDEVRLLAERPYHGERQGREGVYRNEQQVNCLEQRWDPAAQLQS